MFKYLAQNSNQKVDYHNAGLFTKAEAQRLAKLHNGKATQDASEKWLVKLDTTELPTGMELLDFGGGTVPNKKRLEEFFKRYPNIMEVEKNSVITEAEQLLAQP
jgi:hypothetical protein